MEKAKKARLQKAGWSVSKTPDFLGLSPEQLELIDLKISLGEAVRARRVALGMSQVEFARRLTTSQPRLVKIEQGDASLDLLMRALFTLKARTHAARIIGNAPDSPRKAAPRRALAAI